MAPTVSIAAAAGTTTPGTAGQRIATTTTQATATTTSAFAFSVHYHARSESFTDDIPVQDNDQIAILRRCLPDEEMFARRLW